MRLKITSLTILALFLLQAQSIACSCGIQFSENFRASDFVGHVKFEKVFISKKGDPYYKVELEIIEKFKGPEIKTIWIDNDELCPFPEPIVGDELVIFSRVDHLNNLSIHLCSGCFSPNSKHWSTEIEILRVLKRSNQEYVQEFRFETENSFFYQSWGWEIDLPEKDFAIYEVTYDRLNFFIDVKVLESFGIKTDEKISSLLKKSDWYFYHQYDNFSPQLFKFVIILEKEKWKEKYVTKYSYL